MNVKTKRIIIIYLGFSICITHEKVAFASDQQTQTPPDLRSEHPTEISINHTKPIRELEDHIADAVKISIKKCKSNPDVIATGAAGLLAGIGITLASIQSPSTVRIYDAAYLTTAEASTKFAAATPAALQAVGLIPAAIGTISTVCLILYTWHKADQHFFDPYREKIKKAEEEQKKAEEAFKNLAPKLNAIEKNILTLGSHVASISIDHDRAIQVFDRKQKTREATILTHEKRLTTLDENVKELTILQQENNQRFQQSASALRKKFEDGTISSGFIISLLQQAAQDNPKKTLFQRFFHCGMKTHAQPNPTPILAPISTQTHLSLPAHNDTSNAQRRVFDNGAGTGLIHPITLSPLPLTLNVADNLEQFDNQEPLHRNLAIPKTRIRRRAYSNPEMIGAAAQATLEIQSSTSLRHSEIVPQAKKTRESGSSFSTYIGSTTGPQRSFRPKPQTQTVHAVDTSTGIEIIEQPIPPTAAAHTIEKVGCFGCFGSRTVKNPTELR